VLARSALTFCAGMAAILLLVSAPTGASPRRQLAARVPVKTAPVSHPRVAAAPPPSVMHVLFVGASITSGDQQTSLANTFPGRVVAGLRNQGNDVAWQERALTGATVADALTWPYPDHQQVIVIHLITNDFGRGNPIGTYQATLDQLLVGLREGSPEAQLVCLGVWGAPGSFNGDHVSLTAYDAAAQQSCEGEKGHFVPLDGIFADPGSRGPSGQATPWGPTDGWHPNDAGAQLIADAVLAAIPPGAGGG